MDSLLTLLPFALGLLVVPVSFLALCAWMAKRGAHPLCYLAYFFLFGILGGVCIAIGLSPSGLAALCVMFLMVAAPFACLVTSIALHRKRTRGPFEKTAMVLGYGYPGLILTTFLVGQMIW